MRLASTGMSAERTHPTFLSGAHPSAVLVVLHQLHPLVLCHRLPERPQGRSQSARGDDGSAAPGGAGEAGEREEIMRRAYWSPARQIGWYRERNLKICDLIRMGAPVRQIAFKYNLTERSVNKIVKAFEVSNER